VPETRNRSVTARYILMGAVLLLALGGLVMIYSASMGADAVTHGDSAYHLKRQVVYLALGLLALGLCSRIDPRFVRRTATWVWLLANAGLVAVLAIGVQKGGAVRALDVFGLTTVQPSEFAKIACVLMVADLLADRAKHRRPWWPQDIRRLGWVIGVPFVLVMMQPDMGAAMSILLPAFCLLVIGGLEMRWVGVVAAAGALALPVILYLKPYRVARLLAYQNPGADPTGGGYQIIQAMLAFGSGGLTGVGLGLSRQKFFYLPAAHTDFIFAIIGEELGLLGTLLVVALFGAVAWAGFRIALTAKDRFGGLLAGGLTAMIVTQALINMGSVTGVSPVAGEPLPLVSYGGTSLLFTLGCVGLILSVARQGRGGAASSGHAVDGPEEEIDSARSGERRRNGRPRLSVVDGGRTSSRRRAL
jgi:cell division protein FtsW